MTEEIVWGEPPARGGGGGGRRRWSSRLEVFKEHPGQSGRLPGDFSASTVSQLRKGGGGIVPGEWEFKGRQVPGTGVKNAAGVIENKVRYHIWAKYTGPQVDAETGEEPETEGVTTNGAEAQAPAEQAVEQPAATPAPTAPAVKIVELGDAVPEVATV